MSDDIDEFIKKIIKFLKFDSGTFDLDFVVFPESIDDLDTKPNDKNLKGFKISYHFEPGMDKPEVRIEGNMDDKVIRDYLNRFNFEPSSSPNKLANLESGDLINANSLNIESYKIDDESCVIEPYTEINDYNNFSEILFEVPGIEKKDILLSFSELGENLTFSASNKNRKYRKDIQLSFKSSINDCNLDINNGLVILKIIKQNKRQLD